MSNQGPASDQHRLAIGNNPERTRLHNRRVVLDVVRQCGTAGRTRIAELARITPQAVANIVEELVAEGLLVSMGRLRSGRGQPPIQFAINPDGPMTVGVEVASDHLSTVVVDLSGVVRASRALPVASAEPRDIVPLIASEIRHAQSAAGARALLGVGVVTPGPFEVDGMSAVGPTALPGWVGIDPLRELVKATGLPVSWENDATAAAVGERLFGVARHLSDFSLLYFSTGLGLGIISEGRPFQGAFGNAGEIGHVVVAPGGRPCPCGQRGCLERYASLQALRETLAAVGVEGTGAEGIERLFEARHPAIVEWIDRTATLLGPVIALIENLLDPQTVVLGGILPDAVMDALVERLDSLPISVARRRDRTIGRVVRGQTGRFTAALGAASLPLLDTIIPQLSLSPSSASG